MAETNNLSEVSLVAPYKLAGLLALSVERGDVDVKHEQEGGTSSGPVDDDVSDDKIPF